MLQKSIHTLSEVPEPLVKVPPSGATCGPSLCHADVAIQREGYLFWVMVCRPTESEPDQRRSLRPSA